ncbi:XrtA-associated tyrosine autokinase [Neptunomonas japonica]|uniref:XrtA-associated tyrosine autokinase n=1 Tax=Neptunomonas japonica TaxID=417574 RepID=UPI0003F8E63A|nr:XrtA-associated tyrosine autokinase [Neptunomonas japonica]
MSIIERAIQKLDPKASVETRNTPLKETSVAATVEKKLAPNEEQKQYKGVADAKVTPALADSIIHIPLARLSALGMVTPNAPRTPIAEEYRAIKRPLLLNIEGEGAAQVEHANLVMVASALSGEGKTFSAINLAMSIAMEQDKSVLFVDADVSKAAAGELLGVPDEAPGLIDLLENKGIKFKDVVLKSNIPNLRILPAGNLHQRSTELLASENMRSLMLEISRRYSDRVIVFDSPPLLLTTEARVLSNFMGQIAFIVAAEQTSQEAVVEALQHLSSDSIVGMVLNKSQRQTAGGYGYGYGYGYGGRQGENQTVAVK